MILFDFDGVLMNSHRELVLTSFNAASNELLTSHDELPPGYASLFSRNRHHLLPASDIIPFAEWCIQNSASSENLIITPKDFKRVIDSHPVSSPEERKSHFFEARRRLISKDRELWLKLHNPYEPLWSGLKQADGESFVILTNKNRAAVTELCGYFELNIPSTDIYSADNGATKRTNLQDIHKRFGRKRYRFVDDSLGNLLDLSVKGLPGIHVDPIHASWGYIGPNDIVEAEKHNIPSLDQLAVLKALSFPRFDAAI